ncbi:hypothetical protein [Streptomyces sp. NBC_00987]|uniref:hypothetical protein n=1 Tax=Streptomyces sp. NBC_00987 TaxID=2903703 RepID=UPI0038692F0D|nr:hypothetical protein [Streptomyces sp. NBC_00439]WSX06179.1 hypothetical protein OG355_40305 [Streptomyces sp. NBC_00987]
MDADQIEIEADQKPVGALSTADPDITATLSGSAMKEMVPILAPLPSGAGSARAVLKEVSFC